MPLGHRVLPLFEGTGSGAASAFGVVVFFVMNFVVVPMSAAGFSAKFSTAKFIENMLAMILFGLIIAFFGRASAARAPGEIRNSRANQPAL